MSVDLGQTSVSSVMMDDMANDPAPSTPLIGRRRELDQLLQVAEVTDQQTDGGGTHDVVLLGGDAGIGKTRLLRELAIRAKAAGQRVLVGHCLDLGDSALPYQPFAEAFAALDVAERDRLIGRFPALALLLPGPLAAPAAGVERAELFSSIVASLDVLAADRPILLIIEDVHWADASTRHLIRYVLAQGFHGPVHVVISYRADDLHRRHPLRQALAEWVRLAGVRRIELDPLNDLEVINLVRGRARGQLGPDELRAIVRRAAGNAFFVEELLDAGLADHTAVLPETLSDLLLVRLERLDDAATRLVRAASVTDGREGFAALAAAAGLDDVEFDAALGAAVDHKVLRRVDGDSFVFRHALLGEAVRDDLLPGERRRIHAAILAALDESAPAATVARHAAAAGEREIAFSATLRAAEDASRVAGHDEAAQHYEHALEMIDAAPEGTDEVDLVIAAADALVVSGNLMRAIELLRDHLRQLPAGKDEHDRGRLLVAIGNTCYYASVDDEAEEASLEAVTVIPDEPTTLRGEAAGLRARVLSNRGLLDEATQWGERALAIGEQIEALDVITDAKATLTRLLVRSGNDPEKAKLAFRELIETSREAGHVLGELRGYHQIAFAHFNAGELQEAESAFRSAMRRAEETGWTWGPYGFDGRFFSALMAYMRGRWDETIALCAVGPEAPAAFEAYLAATALQVAGARGEVGEIERTVPMRSLWRHEETATIHSAAGLIELHGLSGDLAAARRTLDDAASLHARVWNAPDFPARIRLTALLVGQYASAAAGLSSTGQSSADRAALVDQVPELLAAVDRSVAATVPFGPEGEAWRLRAYAEAARLTWLSGVDDSSGAELEAQWRAVLEAFRGLGDPYESARSAARLAAVLLTTQGNVEGVELAAGARREAERLGARPLLAEIDRLSPKVAAPNIELTPRELEVLQEVAAGRSNGEIGARLFISTKTVSVHVSNILAKLGASGRTEAAAIARRKGLLGK